MTDPRENKLNRMSLMDGILSSKMEETTRQENIDDPALNHILDLDIEQEDLMTEHSPSFGGRKVAPSEVNLESENILRSSIDN